MDEEQKVEPVDLDELERLEREATPGPWQHAAGFIVTNDVHGELVIAHPDITSDATFITALRNAAPALFAEIRRLRQEVFDLTSERDALESEISYCDCSEV